MSAVQMMLGGSPVAEVAKALQTTDFTLHKIRAGETWGHITGYSKANPMPIQRASTKGKTYGPPKNK